MGLNLTIYGSGQLLRNIQWNSYNNREYVYGFKDKPDAAGKQ